MTLGVYLLFYAVKIASSAKDQWLSIMKSMSYTRYSIFKSKTFLLFLVYGMAAGLLHAWLWPSEGLHLLLNVPGMLIGDGLHIESVKLIGDPTSLYAYYTVPWILRMPQVYVPSSILFWGLLGLAISALIRLSDRKLRNEERA